MPLPNSLWTVMSPPICLTIFLLIVSPSPVPYRFIFDCSSSLVNSKNSLPRFSFLIPIPLSTISIIKWIWAIKNYESSSLKLSDSDYSLSFSFYWSLNLTNIYEWLPWEIKLSILSLEPLFNLLDYEDLILIFYTN